MVVDALDECTEDGRNRADFVKNLQNILATSASTDSEVRLLVTSRFGNEVFTNAVDIEIQATDRDIKRFVHQCVNNGLSNDDIISQSVRQNKALQDDLVAKIIEGAGKMYVVVQDGHMLWSSVLTSIIGS